MNEPETLAMLATLTAAYPTFELSRPTAETWVGACRSVQVDDARTACERIVRTLRFFPTIAEFFNEEAAARRAREHREAAERGLPEPAGIRPGRQRVAEMLAQIREELTFEGAKGHWHGGPDPCEKCGGMTDRPGTVVRNQGHDERSCLTCQAGQHWLAVKERRSA